MERNVNLNLTIGILSYFVIGKHRGNSVVNTVVVCIAGQLNHSAVESTAAGTVDVALNDDEEYANINLPIRQTYYHEQVASTSTAESIRSSNYCATSSGHKDSVMKHRLSFGGVKERGYDNSYLSSTWAHTPVRYSRNGNRRAPIVLVPRRSLQYQQDDDQEALVSRMTCSPIYQFRFINSVSDVPLSLLVQPGSIEVPVCDSVPQIRLLGHLASFSFIIDTTKIEIGEINSDGLGPWSAHGVSRVALTKFFFNKDKVKCSPENHEFCLQRKTYLHPYSNPPNSVRKIFWLVTKDDAMYRYGLLTYDIGGGLVMNDDQNMSDLVVKRELNDSLPVDRSSIRSIRLQPVNRHPNCAEYDSEGFLYDQVKRYNDFYYNEREYAFNRSRGFDPVIPLLSSEELTHITNAPVFKQVFLNSINDVPLDILLDESLDVSYPVCNFVPKLILYGAGALLTFIVDTNEVPASDLSSDNLGQWNSKDGRRMNVRKFYYKEKSKCAEGEHDFCVLRRKYVHPHCNPPDSVRKVIWLAQRGDTFCSTVLNFENSSNIMFKCFILQYFGVKEALYALMSYYVEPDAYVPLMPHGNSKFNQNVYIRKRPSEVKRRAKKTGSNANNAAAAKSADPITLALSEADLKVDVIDGGTSDVSGSTDINVDDLSDEKYETDFLTDEVSDELCISIFCRLISLMQMARRVSQSTSSTPYTRTFIDSLTGVPLDILRNAEQMKVELWNRINETKKMKIFRHIFLDERFLNEKLPHMELIGSAVRASFIVDTDRDWPLSTDNLGDWESKESRLSKFFFNKDNKQCSGEQYEYCVIRRRYVHPLSVPKGSLKKVIWQIMRADKSYYRYALISYSFPDNARIDALTLVPHSKQQLQQLPQQTDENDYREEIMRLTNSPVYQRRYIKNISDLPIDLLLTPYDLDEPVCNDIPFIYLERGPSRLNLQLTFIVDTSKINQPDLSLDNLGQWNALNGRRVTVRRYFYDQNRQRCLEGDHDFVVTKRTFVHPGSIPDGGIRKIIWQVKTDEGYSRYALITFEIREKTIIENIQQHDDTKLPDSGYEQKPHSTIGDVLKSSKVVDKMKRVEKRRRVSGAMVEHSEVVNRQRPRLDDEIENAASLPVFADDEEIGGVEEIYAINGEELALRMSQPSSRRYTQPYHNDENFYVIFLNDQEVVPTQCICCGVDFSRHPHPPEDIILEHLERFWNHRTSTYTTQQMQKRYMHARLSCVLARYDYFTTRDFLAVTNDVRVRLTDLHRQYLSEQFYCTVSCNMTNKKSSGLCFLIICYV
uniref:Anaphase-promoting complex subunit 1 n=1 Tax=Syphacia muris TaxID=451379 RepID=A0A0N5AYP1_9BILA